MIKEKMNHKQYGLGRKPSPPDKRDYKLETYIPREALIGMLVSEKTEMVWDFPNKSLDQENTCHCCGFSMASFGINSPTNTMYTNQDGHDFYYLCKVIDGEPFQENGSYIRSAGKVLKNEGKINAYAFAFSMETIKWWLLNRGPLIVGTVWTENMFTPNEQNIIVPTGKIVGGHAYLLNEIITESELLGIQNAWGEKWGKNGKAYISFDDFEKLFDYDGEVMTAVEISPTSMQKKSFWELLLEKIIDFFVNTFG